MEFKLYHGSSQYLSQEAVQAHMEDTKKKNKDIHQVSIEADTKTTKEILDTLTSPSLFFSQRIILLKRIYKNKEKALLTENIIEFLSLGTSNDTILIWEDQKIKGNTKYYKFFKENNAVEESDNLNKRTFFTWLRKELEENKLKIDSEVMHLLAERTNYDPQRCKNEIEKFGLNTEKKIIEREDIESLTADTLEKDIWDLIDAINESEKEESIEILERLFSQFVDPNYILSMLARNLRLIFLTKKLVEKNKQSREISSILKIPPFTTPSLMRTSSKYSEEKIRMLYSKLSNLDHQIKTGRIDGNLGLTLICPYL